MNGKYLESMNEKGLLLFIIYTFFSKKKMGSCIDFCNDDKSKGILAFKIKY